MMSHARLKNGLGQVLGGWVPPKKHFLEFSYDLVAKNMLYSSELSRFPLGYLNNVGRVVSSIITESNSIFIISLCSNLEPYMAG